MGTIEKGSYRETGAPGRRVLAVAAWRSEDRALRAMLTALKELMPCSFDILNLESPTAVHFRRSSRALYGYIRRYDAAVFLFSARDGSGSPALQMPEGPLPFGRHFLRRIPAGYLADGPLAPGLEAVVDAHARAWHLVNLGIATDEEEGAARLESLASALLKSVS